MLGAVVMRVRAWVVALGALVATAACKKDEEASPDTGAAVVVEDTKAPPPEPAAEPAASPEPVEPAAEAKPEPMAEVRAEAVAEEVAAQVERPTVAEEVHLTPEVAPGSEADLGKEAEAGPSEVATPRDAGTEASRDDAVGPRADAVLEVAAVSSTAQRFCEAMVRACPENLDRCLSDLAKKAKEVPPRALECAEGYARDPKCPTDRARCCSCWVQLGP